MTGFDWVDRLRQDVAYASRALRRTPGFTVTVVVTLALGLGLNAALFSLVDRIFLRAPAGVAAPREIRRLYFYRTPARELRALGVSNSVYSVATYREYTGIRDAVGRDTQVAAYVARDVVDVGVGAALTPALVSYVTRGYFPALGVRPSRGRFFAASEDRVDVASPVAVISDALWRRAFGGDPAAVGTRITVAKHAYMIVGIAPPGFTGLDLDRVDLWIPLGAYPFSPFLGKPWYAGGLGVLRVVVRLPTTSAERKLNAVATIAYRRAADPGNPADTTSTVIPGPIVAAMGPADRSQEMSISIRLAGVAAIVLLIACGNIANLLLVRATRRRREIAVRRALGVSNARLWSQLITESVLLSTLGAAVAVLIAVWAASALRTLLFPDIRWADGGTDFRLVSFAAVASLVTGVLAGVAPALQATKPDLTEALKADARAGVYQRSWMRIALMAGQAALSVVLLVGAGLFVRSLQNVGAIELGFDARGLVTVRPMFHSIDDPRRAQAGPALENVAAQLAALPAVESVAMASVAPMQGAYMTPIFAADRDSVPRADGVPPFIVLASPEYLHTLGMHVTDGRFFDARDRRGAASVAVINATMARVVWPGESPLGKCLLVVKRTAPCRSVVGVIDDARLIDLTEKTFMQVYLPVAQVDSELDARLPNRSGRVLLVRTRSGSEGSVMRFARQATLQLLPGVDELRVTSMPQVLEPQLRPWRLGATLFTIMGALAAIVAAVGVYGVIAYGVSQRLHEIGVRVALGAQLGDILRLVVGEGMRVVAVGVAIGLGLAIAIGRLVASLLFGVSPHDPAVLSSAAVLLGLIGAAASFIPALRGARVDPARALRTE